MYTQKEKIVREEPLGETKRGQSFDPSTILSLFVETFRSSFLDLESRTPKVTTSYLPSLRNNCSASRSSVTYLNPTQQRTKNIEARHWRRNDGWMN